MENGQPITLCVLVDKNDVMREPADVLRFVSSGRDYGIVLIPGQSGTAYSPMLAERNGHGTFKFHRIREVGPGFMSHRGEGVKTDYSTVTVKAGPVYPSQRDPVVKQLMAVGFEGAQIDEL